MYHNSKASLLERKKEQWAREREEMSQLYLPWCPDNRRSYRNQFASSVELHKAFDFQESEAQRHRSPSLPPVNNSSGAKSFNDLRDPKKRFSFYEEDGEGDTSGYGSETFQQKRQLSHSNNHIAAWQTQNQDMCKKNPDELSTPTENEGWSSTVQSGSEDNRPKWGDKGVAVGKFWEPQEPPARLPQQLKHQTKGTPFWLERGLNMLEHSSDVLLIDQGSSNSGGLDCDRSSYCGSDGGRNTFLRGQNVPVEPEVKALRETKRIKALEVQSVLISQLEEREKRKKEEKERILKEERMEGMRLLRQQEEERMREEEQQRKIMEKREQESKKLEAIRKAVAEAEETARQEKINRWKLNKTNNIIPGETKPHWAKTSEKEVKCNHDIKSSQQTDNIIQNYLNNNEKISQTNSDSDSNNKSQKSTKVGTPRVNDSDNSSNFYMPSRQHSNLSERPVNFIPLNVRCDVINPLIQSGVQLALLVPQVSSTLYGLAQPMSLPGFTSYRDLNESLNGGDRVLTPRKYRNATLRDAATQTDVESSEEKQEKLKSSGKKIVSNTKINESQSQFEDERSPDSNRTVTLRNERRLRSEERYIKKNIETRPKWGSNVSAAQYKKQSEKDPFYTQKRKLRPRNRLNSKQYSSSDESLEYKYLKDESRSPSPITNSNEAENLNVKRRLSLTQSYWRNKRGNQHFRPSIMNVERVDIKSIEQVSSEKKPMNKSPTKRLTHSQKFINDKYGNRKLCKDDSNVTDSNTLVDINTNRNALKRASMPDIRSRSSFNKSDYEHNTKNNVTV